MLKTTFIILTILFSSVGFSQSSMEILRKYYTKSNEPGGILSIKKDGVIQSSQVGLAHVQENIPISEETRFRMASVSKQFTAMAIYLLIKDGKISFETPILSIFPELPDICSAIQIKHLLNHSSGLVDYENVIPKSQQEQLTDKDVLRLIQNIDTVYFEAGSQFRYSNSAYCLLSLIVERLSNQSYEEFCSQRIFDKLKMTSAQISAPATTINRAFGYKSNSSTYKFADQSVTSATRGDGGVYISTKDYAKWIDYKNPLFSTEFFKDLEKQKIEVKDGVYYSLGFFFTQSSVGQLTLFHSGESTGFHNIILYQPQLNYGISLFTNRDDLVIVDVFEEVMLEQKINLPSIQEPLFLWLNKVYSNE